MILLLRTTGHYIHKNIVLDVVKHTSPQRVHLSACKYVLELKLMYTYAFLLEVLLKLRSVVTNVVSIIIVTRSGKISLIAYLEVLKNTGFKY